MTRWTTTWKTAAITIFAGVLLGALLGVAFGEGWDGFNEPIDHPTATERIYSEQVEFLRGATCTTADQMEAVMRTAHKNPKEQLAALIRAFNETQDEETACGILDERVPMLVKEVEREFALGDYNFAIIRVVILPVRVVQFMFLAKKREDMDI